MSESVIADFVASFNAEHTARGEPAKGRVLLSQKRLVLAATDAAKITIPLSSVLDVAVGHVPPELGDFFDSTVTVAFERSGDRYVACVSADEDKVEKFSTVLFKAILNGTDATIKHPARVGGRVTEAEFVPAKLSVERGTVQFATGSESVGIALANITGIGRGRREIAGSDRPILEIRHMENGQSTMTMAATDSSRELSILGRYIRLEYAELIADLADIDISNGEKEILVALYSGAGTEGVALPAIVDEDPQQVTMTLNRLQEDGLVADTDEGTTLTPKGRVIVSNHLEDVNE
jgi:helix-turn-helix protein